MTDKPIFAHPSAPPSSLCPGLWVSDLCWSERQVRRRQSSSPARRYWTPVYPLLGGAQSTAAKGAFGCHCPLPAAHPHPTDASWNQPPNRGLHVSFLESTSGLAAEQKGGGAWGLLITVENLEGASEAKSKGGTAPRCKHLPTHGHPPPPTQCRPQPSCPHSSAQSIIRGFYSAR